MTYRSIFAVVSVVSVMVHSPAFADEVKPESAELTNEGSADELAELHSAAQSAPEVAQAAGSTTTDGGGTYTGGSDHSRMVRTFGVGYLGQAGVTAYDAAGDPAVVDVPVLGMRYWFNNRMGLDVGLGFSTGGTTNTVGGVDTDLSDPFVMAVRGGVPFALMDSRHFVFEVVPELGFGFSSNTVDPGPGGQLKTSSTHFDIGGRVGAELHFGFIDIPQLALQAGVGLRFAVDGGSVDQGGDEVQSFSHSSLATTLAGEPWDIFAGNVAAIYYFGR